MILALELPISNGLIAQISFTLVVAGIFLWQAFKAYQEVKK
ncbi:MULTISPECIES: hypothetical protein [Oscillatoriales]|jgi:hypothetical protein|uniref:Uncharacterized protein n=1 Tax=Oscillatoria acuminata PCC 6304 TaxID=56110 RepID=K9TBU8_9CYAN|nr:MULTISPECIES: hypothetical protein [Oscillatoriales]AFY79883.1 hypothetical protein Oscil6304_0126 [Oscillatoria acuminata PCC 6304]